MNTNVELTADPSRLAMGLQQAQLEIDKLASVNELFDIIGELPKDWKIIEVLPDGVMWRNKRKRLLVGASIMGYEDGKRWLHVSVSKKDQTVPMWADMCNVKQAFFGRDRKAIQVHPAHEKHVNIHPACLHLWCCLEDDPLPEFSHLVNGERVI